MATRVFLSYARDDDEPFVARLYAALTGTEFDVWFDRVSMPSRQLTFHQEIRDAVAACDRFVLVVGPKAVTSDYVTQEWRFAYFEAVKCVNPIVRLGDYGLIPEDLRLVHAEDFRENAQFDSHVANLIRQLSETLPPAGKLIAVPELPPHYLDQPARIAALRDILLADLRKPVVVSGAAARVGLQGMGGIGKSVLASALAHRPEVQRAFPDSVYWVTLGQEPNLADLQRGLARALGDDGLFIGVDAGKEKLRELLGGRAALLVLDDVWQRGHAEAFNVMGARGRLLVTTRDAGLVTALAAKENHYQVQLPTEAEAEALLARAAGVSVQALPAEARQVVAECGRLPLGLALCGGMVHGGRAWQDVLAALRERDLEDLSDSHPAEEQHRSIWKAMDVSVRALPEDERERFSELAVFALDTGAPEAAVETLWGHTAGLSPRRARDLLGNFRQRSLIDFDQTARRMTLHDLLHNFAIGMAGRRFGSIVALHRRLVNAYRAVSAGGWAEGPNDGYFLENLARHLVAAGDSNSAIDLLTDFSWLMAKCKANLVEELRSDYELLLSQAPPSLPGGAPACDGVRFWRSFLQRNGVALGERDEFWTADRILLQLAWEHADASPATVAAKDWLSKGRCDWFWMRKRNRPADVREDPCTRSIPVGDAVLDLIAAADGSEVYVQTGRYDEYHNSVSRWRLLRVRLDEGIAEQLEEEAPWRGEIKRFDPPLKGERAERVRPSGRPDDKIGYLAFRALRLVGFHNPELTREGEPVAHIQAPNLIVTGTHDGVIRVWDLRLLDQQNDSAENDALAESTIAGIRSTWSVKKAMSDGNPFAFDSFSLNTRKLTPEAERASIRTQGYMNRGLRKIGFHYRSSHRTDLAERSGKSICCWSSNAPLFEPEYDNVLMTAKLYVTAVLSGDYLALARSNGDSACIELVRGSEPVTFHQLDASL